MDRDRQQIADIIMTLAEVAEYLKVAEKTVLRMINRREIPAAKVGNQWRFYRPLIDEWIVNRMRLPRTEPARFEIAELLMDSRIRPHLPATDREGILSALIEPLADEGVVEADGFRTLLLERELMLSTAVGNGVAFPHVRHPVDNPPGGPYLVIGTCPEGVDWSSADGSPVRLFALLSARDETSHLRGISALAELFTTPSLVDRVVQAEDPETLIHEIKG